MPALDPSVSYHIRAELLRLCSTEVAFHRSARRREEILQWLDQNGWRDEVGLVLRTPAEDVPWNRGMIHGSWVHWAWVARGAMYREVSLALDRLKVGDAAGIEQCLLFLEADPWCDGSGYIKELIVRWMRKVRLNHRQHQRLLSALLLPVKVGPRIEFREYCRTARAFATDEFHSLLCQLAPNPRFGPRTGVEQRAEWMLRAIERD